MAPYPRQQGQAQTESFGDTSASNSSTVNGTTTALSTSTHTNGGTDTLSSGDQVGHLYGAVSFDPTTGDIASSTGSDNYDLGKNYSDTYTNLSIGATTTHSDSGFAGATYTDQDAEIDLTTTTDPDTGDVSNDDNTDSFTEDDGSTESFTDQGWVTTGTTSNHLVDNTSLTTHTDNGSDSVSTYDQDTDISSDTSNNGLSTAGTSDTSTESDSSSDSYGDQSSQIETVLGSSVTVTNSTTYSDGGTDIDSTFDQGTDTSSDASSDGLETDSAPDTYTNTESSSDNYTDQSFDFENVASGSVASASSSESSTDSGIDSSWSYDEGTDSPTSTSADGLESDSSSKTFTTTEGTIDQYSDPSYDSEDEESGGVVSETSSASNSDNETDTSSDYEFGNYTNESPTDNGTDVALVAFNEVSTSSLSQTDTSLASGDDDQGAVTETTTQTSDQTTTETTTETLSGSDAFSGIEEDASTYFGSGSFTETYFDSTSYCEDDNSNTTLDPIGLLSGTDSLTDYESDTWDDSHQDWDSISTSGSPADLVTLSNQGSGSTTNPDNETTIYTAGDPSYQGGSTLLTVETNLFSEADPQSNYSDVETEDSTDTTPVEGDETITGGPTDTIFGAQTAYFNVAATAYALEDGYAAPTPNTSSPIPSPTASPSASPSAEPQSVGSSAGSQAGAAAFAENQPESTPVTSDIPDKIEGTVNLASIPASRLLAMVQDNLAISLDNGAYIYFADSTLDGGVYMMLLQRANITQTMNTTSYTYSVVYTWNVPPPADGNVPRLLSEIRTPERGQLLLGVYLGLSDQAKKEFVAASWTFLLNMVPGVASGENYANGNFVEGTISLAGDVSFLLSGPLKALDGARGLTQAARAYQGISNGIEFSVGSFRTGQGFAALQNGQGQQAAGYFGEATLRFMGIAPDVISALKRRSSIAEGIVGGSRSGQRGLTGLKGARNLLEARLQAKDSTCGVFCAVAIIDDIAPTRRHLVGLSNVRSEIRANAQQGKIGLSSIEIVQFIDANLEDAGAVILNNITEDQLINYLGDGVDIMSLVDGNHWVRVLGTVEEGGSTFVKIYDPDRGIYDQLISSFMTRNGGLQMVGVFSGAN